MVAVRKMAYETFEAFMKIVREGKVNQLVPQSHPVCTCTELHSRQRADLEQLKMMNSKVNNLTLKVKKVEEEMKKNKR
jgi:ATP-dependent helicase YprA (DUF1998 family)